MASERAEALHTILRQVRPLHRELRRAVETQLEGTGISMAMLSVLETIDEGGPRTVSEMARELGLPRQVVQRNVNDLLAEGLVARRPNPAHKRADLIELRKRGQRRLRRAEDKQRRALRRVYRKSKKKDLAACIRVLDLLRNELAGRQEDDPLEH